MQLTDKQVKDFQTIYERNFGVVIGSGEAATEGLRLVHLVEVVLKENFKRINSEPNEQ